MIENKWKMSDLIQTLTIRNNNLDLLAVVFSVCEQVISEQ